MIARARATLAWIDTLPEPERTWASFGVPEAEWGRYSAWVSAALVAVGAKGKGPVTGTDPIPQPEQD